MKYLYVYMRYLESHKEMRKFIEEHQQGLHVDKGHHITVSFEKSLPNKILEGIVQELIEHEKVPLLESISVKFGASEGPEEVPNNNLTAYAPACSREDNAELPKAQLHAKSLEERYLEYLEEQTRKMKETLIKQWEQEKKSPESAEKSEISGKKPAICSVCSGTGKIMHVLTSLPPQYISQKCHACDGRE